MMQLVRVWAPLPRRVELEAGQDRIPMRAGPDGWWSVEVQRAKIEAGYWFRLDGEGPFPDPRSPWQPRGIHGPSRLADQRGFRWTDRDWRAPPLSSAVIYELHVGTFTRQGTFEAVIGKLDHLTALGVTHVELMPVGEFPGARGWGYDGVDLFAPHHAYGGPRGLKRLVDACHRRRLAVLLDVVYNHLGPEGNYLARYGSYFTKRYSSYWGAGVNFDGADSGEVRRFFCDNALMWLRDYHLDGLRLDAVHAILDTSARPFLEQLADEVRGLSARLGRHLVLIAESDLNDPRLLRGPECGGFGLDAQWSDDFHHALHAVLTGERDGYYADFGSLAALAKAFQNAYVYDGAYSSHRRRVHGRPPGALSGHRFVVCAQNHDQAGNRARGERSSRLMSEGRLKIAAALLLTSPFIPLLFQGEEWGATTPFLFFTDHQDRKLGASVREGRIREFAAFGWKDTPDPQALATFERSRLDWSERARSRQAGLVEWHQRLTGLRREEPCLSDGLMRDVQTEYDEAGRWFVLRRGVLSVACNLAGEPRSVPLRAEAGLVLLASAPIGKDGDGGVLLPPDSVVIMKAADARSAP